jgi:hypothetical protein
MGCGSQFQSDMVWGKQILVLVESYKESQWQKRMHASLNNPFLNLFLIDLNIVYFGFQFCVLLMIVLVLTQ